MPPSTRSAAASSTTGCPPSRAPDEDAKLRGVERFLRFPGPNGLTQEIYTTARTSPLPLDIPGSGFVTGAGGLGHVALTTKKPHELRGYYNHVYDARLSDYIDETINGMKLKIRFLRVNERHHSVAIASVNALPINPIRTRVQHVNVQAATLDDMVASYQRVKGLGFQMALSVGQHTNDKELSYYALTPSGFEWEVGWNPIVVDEATWKPTTHQGISIWGHTPEGQTVIDKLANSRWPHDRCFIAKTPWPRSAPPGSPTTSRWNHRVQDQPHSSAVSRRSCRPSRPTHATHRSAHGSERPNPSCDMSFDDDRSH